MRQHFFSSKLYQFKWGQPIGQLPRLNFPLAQETQSLTAPLFQTFTEFGLIKKKLFKILKSSIIFYFKNLLQETTLLSYGRG